MSWTIPKWAAGIAGIVVATLVAAWAASAAEEYETPDYTVEARHDAWEIRSYGTHVEARVTIDAPLDEAVQSGFRVLGSYIFGRNRTGASLAMTAPVTAAPDTKVARVESVAAERWTVTFVMPSAYAIADLPAPFDERVVFVQTPPERLAVRRFSGRGGRAQVARETSALLADLDDAGVAVTGQPRVAYYSSPSVPGPLRHNEILIPI